MIGSLFFLSLFLPMEETIPEGPFVYKGLYPREQIVIDPENSPCLEKAYTLLKEELEETLSEEEVLQIVSHFIREKLFDKQLCKKEVVETWLSIFYPEENEPEVPLDYFLTCQMGICRHFSLTTTYFLDRLTKEGILEGQAFLIREQIPAGRHAWTLFLTETSAWHLDSYLNLLEDAKTEKGYQKLCHYYGKRTMERQEKRWQ